MEKENLKFVIVGHVDHGKSTLVGRILFDTNSLSPEKIEEVKKASVGLGRETELAFLLDHLKEEREQGITIDTTQTFFEYDGRDYVIIDAPGHVEFVKNMITGAAQAEAAILIVDAKEGMKAQTQRHANILSMMGIKQVIVVINKMDLAGYGEEVYLKIKAELEEFLKTVNVEAVYFIPISALRGENVAKKSESMPWHSGKTVLESLKSFKGRPDSIKKSLIFPVQDIYKIGDKRIIAGRVESGKIRAGQKVLVLPSKQTSAVKSIEIFGIEKTESVEAGESIGITLEDALFVERGNVICEPDNLPALTDNFRANIFLMGSEGVKEGDEVLLKCATQEVNAEISQIKKRVSSSSLEVLEEDAKSLESLEVGEVVIKTSKPISILKFTELEELGRFVIVKGGDIVAGGIVI